jgi:hypothetical protein
MIVILHKKYGYISGFECDDLVFSKNLKNAMQFETQDAIDICNEIDDGYSISTCNYESILSAL